MESLAKVIPQTVLPSISAGTGSGRRAGESEPEVMSEEDKKYWAAQMGVQAKYLPDKM